MKLVLLWIPLLIISMVGSTDHTPIPLNNVVDGQAIQVPQDISDSTNLKSAIKAWITVLSDETGFDAWKKAKWESLPVGPGTHSWLVVIRKDSLEVGYLIVGAMEDGKHYKLLEYGLGPQPLFSFNTLYQSMMQQALIDQSFTLADFTIDTSWLKERFILNTLENFWRVSYGSEVYYFDGKTGEKLITVNQLDNSAQLLNSRASTEVITNLSSSQLKESIVTPAYDPFEKLSWVKGNPLKVKTLADLKLAIKAHPKLTYMSKLYNHSVIHPFALTGYQLWNGDQIYIALDDEGARYLPLSSLLEAGAFYP
ncbi:hypothetical protein EHS13_22040 [Paenibacillus psychroresistens]|uniref:Uncharacterized protein n=1 Tax=Paenibacillus psychroresistens TaxID=1778678 RepID=A0A6B8RLU8_9BACL|nr:hypothetical protein [Paenibacillus psychroresistens]QGQ97371.1 hypothetical protein EHS13_22040 [Paenibacillus psychroresistens]